MRTTSERALWLATGLGLIAIGLAGVSFTDGLWGAGFVAVILLGLYAAAAVFLRLPLPTPRAVSDDRPRRVYADVSGRGRVETRGGRVRQQDVVAEVKDEGTATFDDVDVS